MIAKFFMREPWSPMPGSLPECASDPFLAHDVSRVRGPPASARASQAVTGLLARSLGPDLLNLAQGRPQLGEPGVLVLTDEAYAPGQGVAAAASDARIDKRVEDLALGLAEPGHNRDRERGEHHPAAIALHAPGNLAAELVLSLKRDLDSVLTGLLAEPAATTLRGRGCLGVAGISRDLGPGYRADDGDLLAVDVDIGAADEPLCW